MFTNTRNIMAIRPQRHVQPMWARVICHGQITNLWELISNPILSFLRGKKELKNQVLQFVVFPLIVGLFICLGSSIG